MSRELLKQALYIIENYVDTDKNHVALKTISLKKQIKAELSKPKPDPVAFAYMKEGKIYGLSPFQADDYRGYEKIKLYISPPMRKPLGDDDIISAGYKAGFHVDTIENEETGEDEEGFIDEDGYVDNECFIKFVRIVEKAHGIGE